MIGNAIHLKLTGLHRTAFQSFCDRVEAHNTKDGTKKLVEQLPEYQYLKNLRVADTPENTKIEQESQQKIA